MKPKDTTTKTEKVTDKQRSRRRFITAGAATAAAATAAISFPNISRAQTVTWRFQSTWPARDIFHEYATDYVARVNAMAGARFRLELLPSGAVVGAFQVTDAVHAGALDGAHGVTGYWYAKHKAASLFGTGAPFGWDANQLMGWFYYGGGEALYKELVNDMLRLNTVGFLTGPMPTQPLGWFKKEITTVADLRGMKYRTIGLSADLFAELGAAVTTLPGAEIVPAIERGLLDGAEFNNPSSDRVLGFPDVAKIYMLGSYHQRLEMFEVVFNKQRFDALPAEVRAILRHAAEAASSDMSWKQQDRYATDLAEMKARQGVRTFKTPDVILQAQLAAWDRVLATLTDPYSRKVLDSQKAWVKKVYAFYREYETPNEMAYRHFFGA